MRFFIGGGTGEIEIPEIPGGGGLGVVDVVSSIFAGRPTPADQIAQSDTVTVAEGQTVLVSASATLLNTDRAGSASAPFRVFIQSGPSNGDGPELFTPSIAGEDTFPIVANATFSGLLPGEYVFEFALDTGKTHLEVLDYQLTVTVG